MVCQKRRHKSVGSEETVMKELKKPDWENGTLARLERERAIDSESVIDTLLRTSHKWGLPLLFVLVAAATVIAVDTVWSSWVIIPGM